MRRIDLNCDCGESFGVYRLGQDADIMPWVSSVNIACGFHAGDPAVMQQTVRLALEHQVAIGAHPGLPDLVGFGRRNMAITPEEAYAMVQYQVGALAAMVHAQGGHLHHVKPHGALYNMAAKNAALARAIALAVADFDADLVLYGLAGSELIVQASAAGLNVASEVFADRSYLSDGSLTPRTQAGALLDSDETAVAQVLDMVLKQQVRAVSGDVVALEAHTVCLHGDGAHALSFAQIIHRELLAHDVLIQTV